MSSWLRTIVLATLAATVPATATFFAQGGCRGCGSGDEEEEEHEGGCGGGGHSGGSGGSGGHKGPGNNLSVPVIFAEGYGLKGLPTCVMSRIARGYDW